MWLLAGEHFTPLDFSVILHVQPVSSPAREMAKRKVTEDLGYHIRQRKYQA